MTSTGSQPFSPVLHLEWVDLSCTHDTVAPLNSSENLPKLQKIDDTLKEGKVGPGGFEDVEHDRGYFCRLF